MKNEAIFFYDHDKINGKLDKWWREFCTPPPHCRSLGLTSRVRTIGGGGIGYSTHIFLSLILNT